MSDEYFDCPVSWCSGYRGEHGEEGDGPDSWLHTSEHDVFADLGVGSYSREGTGATRYGVSITVPELGGGAGQLRDDARRLRALAALMEDRASTLDQGGP